MLCEQKKCSPPSGCGVRSTSTTSSSPLPSTAPGPRGTLTSTTARGKRLVFVRYELESKSMFTVLNTISKNHFGDSSKCATLLFCFSNRLQRRPSPQSSWSCTFLACHSCVLPSCRRLNTTSAPPATTPPLPFTCS